MDNFIAGFAYGATTVIVGQPLDTIKTRMQALQMNSALKTAKVIVSSDGVRGLYRGGLALLLGGSLIRSAQFGVYEFVLDKEKQYFGESKDRVFGVFNAQVVCAGFAGGIGRGLVEGPFEYIKTRRQVDRAWRPAEVFQGSGATIFRNAFLFCAFVVYIDISQQLIPGGLSPFWKGAICSNLAWLTIWPLDVVKSQIQSGLNKDKSIAALLKENVKSGLLFRGLVPGLTRSFIANGSSMVVYQKCLNLLKESRR